MEILALNKEEMKEVINIKEVIEVNKIALREYSKGLSNVPLRTNLNIEKHNGQSLYMPGYLSSEDALGIKIVSVYKDNIKKGISSVPSVMLLIDDETGFPVSIMDGTYLTQLRTGAISGAATDLLARKDSKIFTIIGAGGQAELQLEGVLAIRDIEEVYIFDISEENRKKFVQEMNNKYSKKYNVEIKEALDLEEVIKKSDIITSVTTARNKTFNGEWVKKGTHVNGVGSYTPEMAEIDSELIFKSDKIYIDTKDAIVESGDFVQIVESGDFNIEKVTGELGELILGKTPGRENDEEITFFETTGNAVLDIMAAKKIYDFAKQKNIGNIINL